MSIGLLTPQQNILDSHKAPQFVQAVNQVTSSQILLEAHESKRCNLKRPAHKVEDLEELRLSQLTKRRKYEQQLNKNRLDYGQWMRYAKWEIEVNHDFKRGRSILERALEVNVQHVPLWVRYIELELLHKNVNHARNLLDRAVTTLPRSDKFWFIFVQIEESLANYRAVREVFERWLTWSPMRGAWEAYASFEERYNENEKVKSIYNRYVATFNDAKAWYKWALFEIGLALTDPERIAFVRGVFEAGIDSLLKSKKVHEDSHTCTLIGRWIEWEASVGETERSQAIFSRVLEEDHLLKEQKIQLVREVKMKEQLAGTNVGETGSILKRKLQYEQNTTRDPHDYDSWWELANLEEQSQLSDAAVKVLKKAVATKPIEQTKLTTWRRYVFLWIKLALTYEFVCHDLNQARQAWKSALASIPHDKFSFAKLWIMSAEFSIRTEKGLDSARKTLGRAMGQGCQAKPKSKIFSYYIALEKKLGEYDRVRKIYDKVLEITFLFDKAHGTTMSHSWLERYIEFERELDESERCILLFKLGLGEDFDCNNVILKRFIDFLVEEFRYDEARAVLKDMVSAKDKPELWIRLAVFESSILSPSQMEQLEVIDNNEANFEFEDHHIANTRAIFEEAYSHYKKENNGQSAIEILNSWIEYERSHGSQEVEKIEKKMPKMVSKRKEIDGITEEFYEYEFPGPRINKFLANARKWAGSS
ncbi:protein prenylyltransferase [Metschnikowia bicuspidata]|uniref:Pre-mRNA-splicing factor CLF1 n=1 Tax=Metschnikowia bicuspidata TaxID=27322 RepID=A0A4P9ZDJ5_9ASCO|nr:protein prenylyltransferase [Metschnikowia bicuspidata]